MSRAEDTRFDSWKEIAAHLGRDVRTARRWEEERGLPVHRVPGAGRRAVYAYRSEIDAWLVSEAAPNGHDGANGQASTIAIVGERDVLTTERPAVVPQRRRPPFQWLVASAAILALSVSAVVLIAHRLRNRPRSPVESPASGVKRSAEINGDAGESTSTNSFSRASISEAVVNKDATALQLRPGKLYLYGMVTDGEGSTGNFANAPFAKVVNSAGKIGAALSYGTSGENKYATDTKTHVVGGMSVAGSWDTFDTFAGSNQQRGARFAAVNFTVAKDSLVVVIGLGGGQQYVTLTGLPGIQTDAWSSGSETDAMIIGHVNLKPGNYTITENTSAVPGRPPENMVDLIGVFVFGFDDRALPRATATGERKNGVLTRGQCTDRSQYLAGGSAPFGALRIISGEKDFDQINEAHKVLAVDPGGQLAGTVELRALNLAPSAATVLLIDTPSWGDQKTSWKLISKLQTGESTVKANVAALAPSEPGTYQIIFAFNMEMTGEAVASGTNWALGDAVWYDGNDLAQFDAAQIREAQQFGCTTNISLALDGYAPVYIAADAITIEVRGASQAPE